MPSRRQLSNAIRALSMDAVQQANSGHPGMPMGMADIAEVLWNDFLKHNPSNPNWINRDRFVLSNGHGAMLLYSVLHLSGYDVSIDDLKHFRQLHSKTPGHPECTDTPGVETTTGPLGQGLANGVGMAIAERTLAAQFNRDNHHIIDHFTYVFAGDGCLMEGVSHEVCSLAGTLGLGKLVVFWDDNQISIDGDTRGWFTDDTAKRFEAYGWHVVRDVDGHDAEAIDKAIKEARSVNTKPTLICCRTVIGFGAPNLAGSEATHGAPLGPDEIAETRKNLDWSYGPFVIPEDVSRAWNSTNQGEALEHTWQKQFAAYQKDYPELAKDLLRRVSKELPQKWQQKSDAFITECQQKAETVATRKASQKALDAYGPFLSELLGGSADLTGSNCTKWSGCHTLTHTNTDGNYVHYGVREFGMSAVMNGIALHGGFIPYGGTFLVFIDYARNALRLSAITKQQVIYVLTHDSIGLGEDGPTHQPIEHAAMLRMTPNVVSWRPCDMTETAVAWQSAIERKDGPTCLLLSRQGLPAQQRDQQAVENIKRGGYILKDCDGTPDVILIATGSEVQLAIDASDKISANVRVVSMASTRVFDAQEESYKETVLPRRVEKRVAIEAGAKDFWYKYVGLQGCVIGLDRFGLSAPAKDVFKELGFTVDNVVKTVNHFMSGKEVANGN